jgi:outer membrane protein with beta-barrel domain
MILKRVVQLVAVCALGTVAVAGVAQAQNAQARQGFWFSGGLGYGSLGCDGCGSREGGLSGGLSLGGTISPRFLLGVGTSGWTKEDQGARLTVDEIDARVRFYPSTNGGFFITGGIGYGEVRASISGFGSATESGGAAILGVGYDVRVARNMSITPYWNAYAMKNSNTDANVGQIGLAITLH